MKSAESALMKQVDLLHSPGTMAAFFSLIAECIRPSPAGMSGGGICDDQLRPMVLAQTLIINRCLSLVAMALPDSNSPEASTAMLRFMANLVGSEEELPKSAPEHPVLVTLLPGLCSAVCTCLASNRAILDLEEEGLSVTADFLSRAEGAFPNEFPGALSVGLAQAQVSSW